MAAGIDEAVKLRMQAIADALDISVYDPLRDAVRAPVQPNEIDGIIIRQGFGTPGSKQTYPKGYPATFPGLGFGLDDKLPGVAYASGTFLDILLQALNDELSGILRRGEIWFEWNGTDLSQFDSKVEGATVTSSSASVVAEAGKNWIQLSSTATGGDLAQDAVYLPITVTPPSADYFIVADFVSKVTLTQGNLNHVGAVLFTRYSSPTSLYMMHYSSYNPTAQIAIQSIGKVVTTYAQIGGFMDSPLLGTGPNPSSGIIDMECGVEGSSIVRGSLGNVQGVNDISSPIVAVGKAGIAATSNTQAGTVTNLFRNIRCYTAV